MTETWIDQYSSAPEAAKVKSYKEDHQLALSWHSKASTTVNFHIANSEA